MSIVERALKKLQASGQRQPLTVAVPDRPPRPERHSEALTMAPADPMRARTPTGNSGKVLEVDFAALRKGNVLPPESRQREMDHQFRTLKRPLLKQAFSPERRSGESGASPRIIMVTSALPGEGKTFTSVNLAMSLSLEKDHGVLLVDGDVAKPHVSEAFGVTDEPGLIDVLTDPDLPIESVVIETSVPGLRILPAGRRSETATELLASARMRQQVIQRLEQLDPNGVVVVDSPPILLTTESRVLASLFGQVVLVVRSNATPQGAVQQAISLIGEGPRLGLVLNQAAHEGPGGSYYGYGYGGGYGYGYGDGRRNPVDQAGRVDAMPQVAAGGMHE